jgi:protein phosphatase
VIEMRGLTDRGRKRKNNEDAYWLDPALGLAIVADGMGGHQSGEVASSLAVEAVATFATRAYSGQDVTWPFGVDPTRSFAVNCLSTGIRLANLRVYGEAARRKDLAGMGTTLVVALLRDGCLTYAGVGDSRAYLLGGETLRQLTRDDSWLEMALARRLITAEQTRGHPLRNVLTKAVGLEEELRFDVGEESLAEDDPVLLCSDGLTEVISDRKICGILRVQRDDLERACRALVAAANDGGGPDNISVVLLRRRG